MIRNTLSPILALSIVSLVGACDFYKDDPCSTPRTTSTSGERAPVVYDTLRNPETGACEQVHGGGRPLPEPVDECGDILYEESDLGGNVADPLQEFPWGQCSSECDNLEEDDCLAAPDCRAAYMDDGPNTDVEPRFAACWDVAPNDPVDLLCESMDAQQCSETPDCVAIHLPPTSSSDFKDAPYEPGQQVVGNFIRCADEPFDARQGCYSDDECGSHERCNAADVCLPPPGGSGGPEMDEAPSHPEVCYGYCVPAGNSDAGLCWREAICLVEPPACPVGTRPGVDSAGFCYTNFCIPLDQCEPANCGSLHEVSCIEAPTCSPVYVGSNCECNANGCSCEDSRFHRCE